MKNIGDIGDPRNRPVRMSFDEARARISNAVYEATALLERLEGAGLVFGNCHHVRQHIAGEAVKMLKERWRGPTAYTGYPLGGREGFYRVCVLSYDNNKYCKVMLSGTEYGLKAGYLFEDPGCSVLFDVNKLKE
ncbi:hypothetical protein LCGC14_0701960 [marine sediment metagenome]|uniref:Uncharacterized protein n=1 Tax=marine sediment metagenome TaxID=412755 RepID=A0A0F9QM75_9ZZZZ